MIQDKIHHLSPTEKEIVKNLYRLQESSNDSERALSLFRHYDRDNSGEIDKNGESPESTPPTSEDSTPAEFTALLRDLGMELSNKQIKVVNLLSIFVKVIVSELGCLRSLRC
jgi:hypothetical protein